jgi:hypothetical protein
MTDHCRRQITVAALVCAWLLSSPHALAGEKLLPPDPSAPPTVDDKGVRSDWWDGQYRLLTAPARDVRLHGEVPSRFSLLVIDQEPWRMRTVVDLLGRTLARALGRQARPQEADSI